MLLRIVFGRITVQDLQNEHQRSLEHVIESKDKQIDAVAHAKDHARSAVAVDALTVAA